MKAKDLTPNMTINYGGDTATIISINPDDTGFGYDMKMSNGESWFIFKGMSVELVTEGSKAAFNPTQFVRDNYTTAYDAGYELEHVPAHPRLAIAEHIAITSDKRTAIIAHVDDKTNEWAALPFSAHYHVTDTMNVLRDLAMQDIAEHAAAQLTFNI